MARLIPSNTPATPNGHTGEQATLQLLQRQLPDCYTVFHSVHWTMEGRNQTAFGEIDFVVVNQSGHVLVIEQKNGSLQETAQGLVKDYGNRQRNLQSQIGRSVEAIRKKYSTQNPGQGLIVDYLIFCPDHALKSVNAAALDSTRVVDAQARESLAARINTLLGPGQPAAEQRRVLDFFRQSYNIVPDVGAHIRSSDRAYTRLSTGLLETVRNIQFSPFRLRIQGVAGCGKTQVALSFLTESASNQRSLYVCFNRPLRDHIAELAGQASGEPVIETFHGLCRRALEAAGETVDFSELPQPGFWTRIVERVIGITVPESLRFNRIIVDEGQDFSESWWDVLQLFLTDDYELLWFEDRYQNLQGRQPLGVPASVTYSANVSYRTPQNIAAFISETHGVDFRSGLPVQGLGVGVYGYEDPKEQVKLLRTRVNDLRKMGFRNEDIVILTCYGLDRSVLFGLNEIAGTAIRKFTHGFTADHQPIYTDGSLLFDSVYRYKGQQSPAVILVDVDPSSALAGAPSPVVFCGMTRATTRLEMLVAKTNSATQRYFDAAEGT